MKLELGNNWSLQYPEDGQIRGAKMSANLSWYFRERDPGEAKRGGNDNFAFQMSIDTLVRETIQNSNDQRVADKVIVEFVVEEHRGESAQDLLDLIGWNNGLRQSLEAIAKGDSHLARRASKALRDAKSDRITSLTIRDRGARGLEGDEDGESGNFVMLCRHVLVTDATRKALRGGAFGIGKSVIWAFSGTSVALFSSLPLERGSGNRTDFVGEPRFFGRAYLVSHKVEMKDLNSDGHLGSVAQTNGKNWAVSVRGTEAKNLVRKSVLDRNWTGSDTGTSILIPFLNNPSVEEELTARSVIPRIVDAVQKWFWPSIESGLLEVRVGSRVGGKEILDTIPLPAWAKFFQAALGATSNQQISDERGTGKEEIEISIPRRDVDPKHSPLKGLVGVHIARISEDDLLQIPTDVMNSVALVRGARMVVQYYEKSISSLVPPFVGIAKVGEYRGAGVDNSAIEAFFRDSEPPAHDRWEPTAGKLKENYAPGAQAEIRRFLDAIGFAVNNLLGGVSSGSGRTPRKLAQLLSGGKGREKKPRKEKFSMERKEIDRSVLGEIRGSVTIRRNSGTGTWTTTLAVVLVDEQGTNREIPITAINDVQLTSQGVKCTNILGQDNKSVRLVQIGVPGDIDSIDVELIASTAHSRVAELSLADIRAQYS